VLAAEVGHLDLAYDYLAEAALMDLDDLEHNTRDGLHIASLAASWIAAVAGFGGMRDHDGVLSFKPRLPPALSRLAFRLMFRGRRLVVDIDQQQAQYTLSDGQPLEIVHHGAPATIAADGPITLAIPTAPRLEPPSQPPGREPDRRRPLLDERAQSGTIAAS
jgi:alpha,alpha-trehalose phosphorylase